MEDVKSLNWKFDFGIHNGKTIKETIESNPDISWMSNVGIDGKLRLRAYDYLSEGAPLIQYLEWAEKEEILTINPSIWEEIKNYNNLYTRIKSYELDSKKALIEYDENVKRFNLLKNE